jgi:hypothetical protein
MESEVTEKVATPASLLRRPAFETSDEGRTANEHLPNAIDDAELLLSFVAENGYDVADDVVKTVIESRRRIEVDDLDADQEFRFWAAFKALSKAVAPVSVSSLRDTTDTLSPKKAPSMARGAVSRYTQWSIVALAFLLLVQVYWLFGSQVTTQINQMNKDIAEADQKIRSLQRASATSNIPVTATDDVDIKTISTQRDNTRMQKDAAHNLLRSWNLPWEGWLVVPVPADDPERKTKEAISRMQQAQTILEVIQRYVLPLLWGLLGSCVYILRKLSTEIKARTYSEASNIGFRLRAYLGTLGGMVIAWFIVPDATEGLIKSLSPFALAFLAGYSVELVFAAMDRILGAFTDSNNKNADKAAGAK